MGGNGHGEGVTSVKVPVITVTFDLERFAVTVGGSAPNLEFAKAMLLLAVDETEKQIARRDAPKVLQLGGGLPFEAVRRS